MRPLNYGREKSIYSWAAIHEQNNIMIQDTKDKNSDRINNRIKWIRENSLL